MKPFIACLLWALCFSACSQGENERLIRLIKEWNGKEIKFPTTWELRNYAGDSTIVYDVVDIENYAVFVYADSTGCVSCKLALPKWSEYILKFDSLNVPVLFVFNPKTSEQGDLKQYLRRARFSYPVYIDKNDSFNILNRFPRQMEYQTFLINAEKKVVAVGNPIYSNRVKDLYFDVIQGEPIGNDFKSQDLQTTVSVPSAELSLGDFPWQERPTVVFTLKNTGCSPLVIQDAVTSCGCLTVDYTQQPVPPGGEAEVRATYRADTPGYSDKGITVSANVAGAPLKLRVRGARGGVRHAASGFSCRWS